MAKTKKIRHCAKCGKILEGSASYYRTIDYRVNFCADRPQCKNDWIKEHSLGGYVVEKPIITHMDIYVVPERLGNLSDPDVGAVAMADLWTLHIDSSFVKGVNRETMRIKFDQNNKTFIDKDGNVIEFENGKEMADKATELMAAAV